MFDFAVMPSLGIDLRSIAFQLFNFGILLWVLQRFAFRPLLQVLQDRRDAIAEQMKTAEGLARATADMEKKNQNLIAQARKESENIVRQAKESANTIVLEAQEKAVQQADAIKARAEQEIEQQIESARSEMKGEMASLVVMATEKIIKQKLDGSQDEALITQALHETAL